MFFSLLSLAFPLSSKNSFPIFYSLASFNILSSEIPTFTPNQKLHNSQVDHCCAGSRMLGLSRVGKELVPYSIISGKCFSVDFSPTWPWDQLGCWFTLMRHPDWRFKGSCTTTLKRSWWFSVKDKDKIMCDECYKHVSSMDLESKLWSPPGNFKH